MNKLPSVRRSFEELLASVDKQLKADPEGLLARWTAGMRDRFDTPEAALKGWQYEMHGWRISTEQLRLAKTILFSTEQIEVFRDLPPGYADSLDYRLPFPFLFIQLSSPFVVDVPMDGYVERSEILYFVLAQQELTEEALAKHKAFYSSPEFFAKPAEHLDSGILNSVFVIYKELNTTRFGWMSESAHEFITDYTRDASESFYSMLKRLCIALVGYINCENIYLEEQGGASEAVNRKRAAKGKARIEPYYVCRIKGVQSPSHATGTGVKHSIRYDVRGHFRRLDSGKTIWVRPHQRGVQNELYIPKVYKVTKGSKPAYGT